MKKAYIGLDVGGSKIEGILWHGKILESRKISTPKTRRKFLTVVLNLLGQLSSGAKVGGIGLAVAGVIDLKSGKILRSPNLRFLEGMNLKENIRRRFARIPVRIDNDAKCFLRGELNFGQARGKTNVVALTLGTGVGGGVALDGKILRGTHGPAFELGHIVLAQQGKQVMSLESLVSSHGFLRLHVRHPLDAQNRAYAGDRKSIRVYEQIGKYLGLGLANLINIFDPQIILLGGGISRARSLLIKPAAKEAKKYILNSLAKLTPVRVSKLKSAGALGAVSLFL